MKLAPHQISVLLNLLPLIPIALTLITGDWFLLHSRFGNSMEIPPWIFAPMCGLVAWSRCYYHMWTSIIPILILLFLGLECFFGAPLTQWIFVLLILAALVYDIRKRHV